MANIVTISGSPSQTSRLNESLSQIHDELHHHGHKVTWLNVRELPAEDLISGHFESPEVVNANRKVLEADGIIVSSPVYKASFTGLLKTYLDLLPYSGLQNKVVLPVMTGGTQAHLLALEYALKPVCSALGARNILQGVYVLEAEITRDNAGIYHLGDGISKRLVQAAQELSSEILASRLIKRHAVDPGA